MFTVEEREAIRQRVLEITRSDPRVTGGAITGSSAAGTEDRWSDIDVAFGIAGGFSHLAVLEEWTALLSRELGVLHYWDLQAGPSIYRVMLLPGGLEIDLAVTPERDFGARGPTFRLLFGSALDLGSWPPPDMRYLVGLCWHHLLHARASIERGKPWRAEYWISAARDHTLELACLRLGEKTADGRGIDLLPQSITAPFAGTLVRSLGEPELRRALTVATTCLLDELGAWDPELSARLKPVLEESAGSHRTAQD